jgi:hypothetical protein
MDHRVRIRAEGLTAEALTRELETVPGAQVASGRREDALALDPNAVSVIVAGFGTVNALIGALATVWAATRRQAGASPTPPAAQPAAVLEVHTDLDQFRVVVSASGVILEAPGTLPSSVEDVTEIHIAPV